MSRPWTADLGNGTYRNPVLNSDWSDPDVVRVGEDYYLTASSFGRVPGLPLLHSRDLVNWSLLGHALERLEPAADFAVPRHDCGVWAPSLRHHAGRFWIFWGDPDHGIHQINAEDIRGPWSAPHLVKAGKGLIDACPLWDEETGEAYLVHAWAKSRSGIKNRLTGHRMSPDGRELLDEGKTLVDADTIPGWFTLEGPKLYRHDGYFWIFAPAGGVETGWQGAFRSRNFFGPYEEKVVLAQGATGVNGPHQGAWVQTAEGGPSSHWFLHFQSRGPYGRVVHLQPMSWPVDSDGWPVIGDGGEPVAVHAKPEAPEQPVEAPASSDDFPGGRYGRQWQWTATPRPGWTVEHGGDGLRLSCVRTAYAHDLRALSNVLVQRLPAEEFSVEVDLALHSREPGANAGLAVLGDAFSWIGLEAGEDGTARLVHRYAEAVAEHERDAEHPRAAPEGRVRIRIAVTTGARCRFFADTGDGFRLSGQVFAATPWRWVGALLGLFATAPAGTGPAGTASFTAFRTSG
ncbi:family 43 glycosylhydrolase [Streptomyces sp. NBC_00887]|uniref:glycoside hydrolase family 43 protein n=1 Tax=Streptomyces sp. NBC_00887 TaxID=2975859 RepID=UPI003863510A|nr:glycoside hydrolase 43 family protein [Streptomyces sp. NBC_00887]WSY34922.1 glycoside hydrolase 43 family protein [Streptomyces sp. NBC_00887]